MIPRFFSKDETMKAMEWAAVIGLGVCMFAGGFLLGQLWSVGNFLIWAFS
jgi:hypothetical protein